MIATWFKNERGIIIPLPKKRINSNDPTAVYYSNKRFIHSNISIISQPRAGPSDNDYQFQLTTTIN